MYLVVGAGFLGSNIINRLKKITDEKIVAAVHNPQRTPYLSGCECVMCDLTSAEDIKSLKQKCNGEEVNVFYLAACHNIDFVFENPEKAEEINIHALTSFLNEFNNINRLLFASTDCVYGEDNGFVVNESSLKQPVNIYGEQKLKAEGIVCEHEFTNVRLPFMTGPSLIERPHFYDNIINTLKVGNPCEMVDGLYRSALSYSQTAELLVKLIHYEGELPNAINVCGDRAYSKYEIGRAIAKNNNVDISLIKKISSDEGRKFFKDKRADSTAMDNSLLKDLLGIKHIRWDEDKC